MKLEIPYTLEAGPYYSDDCIIDNKGDIIFTDLAEFDDSKLKEKHIEILKRINNWDKAIELLKMLDSDFYYERNREVFNLAKQFLQQINE